MKNRELATRNSQPATRNSEPATRNSRLEWGVLLALAALVAVPFGLNLTDLAQARIPWFMDTATQFYPFRLHAARLIASGELPLWNRTVFGGVPFLANPQWGLLYPGNWPMLVWPGPRSFLLVNVAHVALLGVGTFLWVRLLTGSVWAALSAGLAVELGGWTRAHEAFGSYLQVGAWTPWLFWAFRALNGGGENRASRWGIAAGVFGAMQWLGGAPQLALYCQAGLVLYLLATWATSIRNPPKRSGAIRNSQVSRRSAILFLGAFALVSLGLSAPQWTTTRAFLQECERGQGLTLEQVTQGALSPRETLRAWIGGTGRPEDAETILYPGYVALFLALVGLASGMSRGRGRSCLPRVLPLVLLVLLPSLFCCKSLAPILYRVAPFYDRFHDPRRVLFLAYLGAIALSAQGFAFVFAALRRESASARSMTPVLLPILLILLSILDLTQFVRRRVDTKTAYPRQFELADIAAATGIAPGERFFAHDVGIQYSYNYTRPNFAQTLLPNLGALYGLEDVQGYDPFIPWRYGLFMRLANRAPIQSVTLYPNHFGLVRNADSPWLRRFGPLKARGPIDFDWPFFAPRWLAPGETMDLPLARRFDATPENAARLRVYLARTMPFILPLPPSRVRLSFYEGERPVLGPLVAEKRDPVGTDYLFPDVLPPSDPISSVTPARIVLPKDFSQAHSWADRVSIRNPGPFPVLLYSLGLPRESGAFRPTAIAGTFASTWADLFPDEVRIWESPTGAASGPASGARAWLEYELAPVLSPDQVNVEIPRGEGAPTVPARAVKGWKWIEKKSNRLRIALPDAHPAGWVVLSEAFAPGWRCWVDGTETTIRPADVMFRAVPVAADARKIEMRYVAPGLRVGVWLFGLTVLSIFLVLIRKCIQRYIPRRPQCPSEP